MASFPKTLKELCRPALIYFLISVVALIMVLFQNLGDNHSYYLGYYSCHVPNVAAVFVVKLIYILFWTYILNLICKDGHSGLSWLLVLLPFILFFVILGLFMLINL
jgi:hypothetical protein